MLLLPSFIVRSSFLGFKRIVDNDVKDLLEKFQNVKLAAINDKFDDMPTKEENERVIEKLFSFHTSMMDRFDRMESLLRKVERKLDGKVKKQRLGAICKIPVEKNVVRLFWSLTISPTEVPKFPINTRERIGDHVVIYR